MTVLQQEFSGEITALQNIRWSMPKDGGHIPGASNHPWASAVNDA